MFSFTEILKSHISGIKIDINPVRLRETGGVGGPDDQVRSCHSETSDPLSLVQVLAYFLFFRQNVFMRALTVKMIYLQLLI